MDHGFDVDDRRQSLQSFFTPALVLTPAADQDFGQVVATLTQMGRFDEAGLLGAACVTIQHYRRLSMAASGTEACRHAGLPQALTWIVSGAGAVSARAGAQSAGSEQPRHVDRLNSWLGAAALAMS